MPSLKRVRGKINPCKIRENVIRLADAGYEFATMSPRKCS